MRDRDTSTGCLSLLAGNRMLSYGGKTLSNGRCYSPMSHCCPEMEKKLSAEKEKGKNLVFFVLKPRYLLQFGGKLCICIVRGEMSVRLGGKMGQICGPIEDLICRVLHQDREHLPDPEVCVSGEKTWCSGQPRCTASCILVNV